MSGSRRGDLYAHVEVEIPKKLSSEQRKLFEQLDEQLEKDADATDGGFFGKLRDGLR